MKSLVLVTKKPLREVFDKVSLSSSLPPATPPRAPSLALYFPFINLAFQTSLSIRIPNNPRWGRHGYFLEFSEVKRIITVAFAMCPKGKINVFEAWPALKD